MQEAHHSLVDDYEIIVDYNRQQLMPGWIPRRLGQLTFLILLVSCYLHGFNSCSNFFFFSGGGFGGKKESGQLRFGGRERPFRAPMYDSSLSHSLICCVKWLNFQCMKGHGHCSTSIPLIFVRPLGVAGKYVLSTHSITNKNC